jgi:PPP family 3-phenylpropionic acid transporter
MFRVSAFIFLLFSTYSVVGFFMPLYLKSEGLDSGQIGMIIACGSLVAMVAQPFWGFVSDKRKTVKRILILLMSCCLLTGLGLFSVNTFVWIMLCYIVFSFFNSATAPLTETLCFSYARENNKEYGRIRLWGEIGVGISALLLGLLIERIGIHHLKLIYGIAISVAILAGFMLRDSKATPVTVDFKALAVLFRQPRLLWFLFTILLVAIPHKMNDTVLALYLAQLGAPASQLGTAWLVATLSSVPAMMVMGTMIRRWNELGILVIAAAGYAVRWAVYGMTDNPTMLVAAQALHIITFPLMLIASIQYLSGLVPSELRATGQAAFAVTFSGLGGIIGSAGGGYAFGRIGASYTYGIGSMLALLGAIAILATYIVNRRLANRTMVESLVKQPDQESVRVEA